MADASVIMQTVCTYLASLMKPQAFLSKLLRKGNHVATENMSSFAANSTLSASASGTNAA